MRREVERELKLRPFAIDVGEFELLWNRLMALFDEPEKVYSSIDLRLLNEQLEFNDVEELKQYAPLRGTVTEFSMRVSQGRRRITIRAGSPFTTGAAVTAAAGSEA